MISSHCCPVGLHGYDLGRSHSSLAVFSINGREDCQLYGEIYTLKTCCWILGQGDKKLPLQHGEVEREREDVELRGKSYQRAVGSNFERQETIPNRTVVICAVL